MPLDRGTRYPCLSQKTKEFLDKVKLANPDRHVYLLHSSDSLFCQIKAVEEHAKQAGFEKTVVFLYPPQQTGSLGE